MATKAEVKAALTAVDELIEGMRGEIVAGAEKPLASGSWTVRDALCHLAGRSNSVPLLIQMVGAYEDDAESLQSRVGNIDEVNAGQISDREGKTAAQIVDEIVAGHETARAAVDELDETMLAKELPAFRGDGTMPASQLLLMASAGHDRSHVNEIAEALGVTLE